MMIFQGFNEGSLAAGLPDLAFLTNASTDQIATIYTWRNVAGVLGSLALGKAIDRRLILFCSIKN